MSSGILDPRGYVITNPNDPMIKVHEDKRAPEDLTEAEWTEIHSKLRKAFIKLIVHFHILGRMTVMMANSKVFVMDPEFATAGGAFRTMATDGRVLYIWPQYVLYHSVKELMAVLLHELYHNLLCHIDRGAGYDPLLANIAMDISVNNHVNDGALEQQNRLGKEMVPEYYDQCEFYIPVDRGYAIDHKMRDDKGHPLMWEEIYDRKLKSLPKKLQDAMAAGYKLSPGDANSNKLGRPMDDHNPWKPSERPANEKGEVNLQPFDRKRPEQWAIDADASLSDKAIGFTPSGIKRLIDELIHPPIPWYRLLSNYFNMVPGHVSWIPGDLRMDEPAMWITPTFDMEWMINTFDTSGSMSNEDISSCITQANAQISGFPNMKGRLYFWDAKVHDRMDIEDWRNEVPREVHGGGGTSLLPQFAALEDEELIDKTKVVCIFTDGYVDWDAFTARVIPKLDSREYPFDIIFVFTNQSVDAPVHPRILQTRLHVDDHY